MLDLMPQGVVALDDREMQEIVGGSLWKRLAAAAAFGFTVGRWLACAFECLAFDN